MNVYAMSDIHGCIDAFEYALSLVDLSDDNKLILLGDYVHGPNSYSVLDKIMKLQQQYGSEKVIALMGNHEAMVLNGEWTIARDSDTDKDDKYLCWMRNLPLYHIEGNVIFVHAGIDEEAGEYWEWGLGEDMCLWKYPAELGHFYEDKKIVAGHISTAAISGDRCFHDIYYDGESHYYIDGNVLESGYIPVLKYNVEQKKFYQVMESKVKRKIMKYDNF